MKLPWRRYDPARYWASRADPNVAEPDPERAAHDRDFIARALTGAATIFELGPGTGRTFAAYRAGQSVTTRDITDRHKDRLADLARARGITLTQTRAPDPLSSFDASDQSFDAAICIQVFLHMPPPAFDHAISELSRIARRLVIVSGYHATFAQAGARLPAHVFSHDYIAALNRLNRPMSDIRSRAGILYLVADRA